MGKILVIDDERPIRRTLCEILEFEKFKVDQAEDGEQGLNLAGWCKKLTGLPSITVGSVGLSSDFIGSFQGESSKTQPISLAVERLARGEFDMIAVGRALLQDPDWAQKIRQGRHNELADWDSASLAKLY